MQTLEEPKEIMITSGAHFDVYTEPGLSETVIPAVQWFEQHLLGRQYVKVENVR